MSSSLGDFLLSSSFKRNDCRYTYRTSFALVSSKIACDGWFSLAQSNNLLIFSSVSSSFVIARPSSDEDADEAFFPVGLFDSIFEDAHPILSYPLVVLQNNDVLDVLLF